MDILLKYSVDGHDYPPEQHMLEEKIADVDLVHSEWCNHPPQNIFFLKKTHLPPTT